MARYKFYQQRLKNNIRSLREAFIKHDINLLLSYSYKTNNMECIYQTVAQEGLIPEVVSEFEYVKSLDFCDDGIMRVCNGVSMTYADMAYHVRRGDLVNFNDVRSIEKVGKIIGDCSGLEIGLRISYNHHKSRFGIRFSDLPYALSVAKSYGFDVECLHCHATATREGRLYRDKCRLVVLSIMKLGIRPLYIDFGGGMYSKLPDEMKDQFDDICSYDDYAKIIAEELSVLDYQPIVILECGTALVSDTVEIEANVVRVDEYDRVVIDCDKYTLGMMHKAYIPYDIITDSTVRNDFKVYGCTCIEDDVILDLKNEFLPKVGDKVILKNCGSYTYSLEPSFIIDRIGVEVV